jgi:sulfatase maturation enzyme AslB (radical SAM superfamily)
MFLQHPQRLRIIYKQLMRYSLHITNNCNLHCTYCYEDDKLDKNRKRFVISLAEIDEKMARILSAGNCDELELLGGEIFLYPDKVRYILENYRQYFPFILTTNGMLRDADIDDLLTRYKLRVGVSLDDPQTIERQRIGIDFKKVLANAKHWRNIANVVIDAVITPLNIRRIKETFDFYIIEQGFEAIHFGCVEEWMNDYYWEIYKREVLRLLESTDTAVLRKITLSPWQYYAANKKQIIYEDGIEKMEIFDPTKVDLVPYKRAVHYCHEIYCQKLGLEASPLVPAGVRVVSGANNN